MIHVVTAANSVSYKSEMEQVWRLRHQVFVVGKKWHDLARPDGREIDQFDTPYAVHFLVIKEGQVLAYSRLLPTTRPHLLSDVFPHLCDGDRPAGHDTYEWTRQAISPLCRARGKDRPITFELVAGIVEWGLANGVTRLIAQIPMPYLLQVLQLHFRARILGLPAVIAGERIIAVAAEFGAATLARVNEVRGDESSVLAPSYEHLVA